MYKYVFISLAFCCLSACGNGGNDITDDVSKLQFSTEVNPVRTMLLRPEVFHNELVSNGKAYARTKSVIGFRSSGTIADVKVKNGDYVRQGAVLAVLDGKEADLAYRNALENLEKSKIDLTDAIIGFGYRLDTLHAVPDEIMSIAKIRSGYNLAELSLENALKEMENCTIKAPFAGKVANIIKNRYEKSGDNFCTIAEDTYMIVEFRVFESELNIVKAGQPASVSSFFKPGETAKGHISAINPVVDERGQVLVQAEIRNSIGLMDGMNVKVSIEDEVPGQLVVPKSAVLIRDNLEVLFRYSGGRAKWTYVHILNENSHSYVVAPNESRASDLNVGDTIIISGNLNLAHDSVVELAEH